MTSHPSPSRPRILVVEDSATQAAMLADLLESNGFDTLVARSGERALELIRDAHAELLFEGDAQAMRAAAGAVCGDDARSTAAWTRAVLHGHSPMPLPLVNQVACCLYGAGYTVDMNQAKAIAAVQTGSLLAA